MFISGWLAQGRLLWPVVPDLHGAGGTAVGLVVVGALGLVEGLLRSALAVVGLEAASNTVGGVGDSLLDLVLGGLAGVRSDLLLSLCGHEVSIECTVGVLNLTCITYWWKNPCGRCQTC